MVKLKILNSPIHVKSGEKDGRAWSRTSFVAQVVNPDGSLGPIYGNCQSYGDRKVLLEEAIKSENPIEVESVEFKEQFNNYDVQFPKGAGGESGYRKGFGGGSGKAPWTPKYKGKPVSFDRFVEVTGDAFAGFVKAIKKGLTKEEAKDLPVTALVEQARSLVAQYWMAVEEGLTYPTGAEPDKVTQAPDQPAAPAATQGQSAPAQSTATVSQPAPSPANDASNDAVQMVLGQIAEAKTLDEVQAININKIADELGIPAPRRSDLFMARFKKESAIKAATAA